MAGQASVWMPTTRTEGLRALTATAMPVNSAPPPMGTTMVSISGFCSRISMPMVPWPP